MSNFEGIQKNAKPFRPQSSGGRDAGVGRVVAGVYAGQDAPVVFEKADQPVLDTDPTPRTDGAGERELNLQVDHPNRDGGAVYLAGKIARVYRRLTADGASLESLSVEQRRQMRDELIQGVYDGDGQHPSGEAASRGQEDVLTYITGVANLLFGLADEIPGTPTFLTRSDSGGFLQKMAGGVDGIECPHCHTINPISKSAGGLQVFTCTHCAKYWEADPSLMLRKSDGTLVNPDLAALRKRLAELTAQIQGILARRAGVVTESGRSSDRFITKGAGSNDPQRLMKQALENGTSVAFSGQDPRDQAAKSGGRRFQTRG